MSKNKKRLSKFINFSENLANDILLHFAECGKTLVLNFLTTPYKGVHYDDLFGLTRRLEKNNIIQKTKENDKAFFALTEKGWSLVSLLKLKKADSKKWDGKWRVLIFDVPEKRKKQREFLRDKLKELGFEQLQESVWVFPHSIPKSFDWLLKEVGLKFDVRYLVVESMNYEKDLLRKFNLSR